MAIPDATTYGGLLRNAYSPACDRGNVSTEHQEDWRADGEESAAASRLGRSSDRRMAVLSDRLPTGWSIQWLSQQVHDARFDALWKVTAPDGTSAVLVHGIQSTWWKETRHRCSLLRATGCLHGRGSRQPWGCNPGYCRRPCITTLPIPALSYINATGTYT